MPLISLTLGGYDDIVPFITILIWNAVNSDMPFLLNLYSLNVSSSSAGVCAVSSLPSPLNGTHASELISLTSADDVVLK